MEKIFDAEMSEEKKNEIIKRLDEYLAAFTRLQEEMVRERREIDQIKAETWNILDQRHFDPERKAA
jgi:phenylpyruvate tautomerase PptA (4-oxalocrotonate tautomerase family)